MPVTLHCESHGWHPKLEEIIERLGKLADSPREQSFPKLKGIFALLGAIENPRDRQYLDLLVSKAGAWETGLEECSGERHLVGCICRAIEVLRSLEEEKLKVLFSTKPE